MWFGSGYVDPGTFSVSPSIVQDSRMTDLIYSQHGHAHNAALTHNTK